MSSPSVELQIGLRGIQTLFMGGGLTSEINHDTYLSDLSPRDKPWDTHKAQSELVRDLYRGTDFDAYSHRIRDCAESLAFGWASNLETGELALKLQSARFCRVRLCPTCQWRRSLMWIARFHQAIPKIVKDNPTARFVFLTLTAKNCELSELRSQLDRMNKAWTRLSQRKAFPALGWVKSVEVTRGKDGTAHPHIHAVLMVQSSYFSHGYITQATWTELWQKSLRVDYTPVVNVKAVRPKKGKLSVGDEALDMEKATLDAIRETLKYSVKPSDLAENQEWLVELTHQLRNSRAVAVGGLLKQYISDQEPEDLIHAEDAEPEDVIDDNQIYFNWRERVKKYAHKKD